MIKEKLLKDFIENSSNQHSASTLETYERYIRKFLMSWKNDLSEVTDDDIDDFLNEYEEKGYNSRTIHVIIAALHDFFSHLKYKKYISVIPTVDVEIPNHEKKLPKPLSEIKIIKLKNEAKDHLRDRAIIEVLHWTGVRVSELINIRIEDIWWDTREIWIRKGKGLKERNVIINYICKQYLIEYLDTRSDDIPYLFITKRKRPFTRQGVNKLLNKYAIKAGIKENVTPHMFRHTFITDLINKGAEEGVVADLAGHEDIKRLKDYTEVARKRKKLEYEKLH
ncbi:tyrosine-type recombinase/integrase [Natranaerobius thermophilus]|uniref:Integrase family protein n=1 Tax=Natranaerobius thermophilus (strain ATCC BAA-1301 / DSM 18059 / JW/NM-WN-LF) TaxID=457570 RepID=B2A3Z7_NATTJ|nr:tyrosine-type recombinase/integrase [Natranaerobius thermophilus]ACB85099.1 integrase family protein [Natranaerobius thermophilus JW/NM-WN-LF]